MARNLESPEEHGEGSRPPRGGERSEGGFEEGSHGRGPTPYKRSQSAKPNGHPIEKHFATAGRGGSGIIGGADGFKGHKADIEHPQSHSEFEALGADGPSTAGGEG